jgi:serine protease Do
MGIMMRCPKCQQEQNNTVECDVCGVIFARFQKVQERRQEQEAERASEQGKKRLPLVLSLVLLVAVVAGTTYYLTVTMNQPQTVQQGTSPVTVAQAEQPPENPKPRPVAKTQQLQEQQPVAVGSGNVIERAKNATVSIETPWGTTGAGFFVNQNYIVTNKHVVQFDEKKITELRSKIEKDRRFIELEQQKLAEWKGKFQQMPKSPARSQLAMIIEQHEEELRKVLPKQEESERRLEKVDRKILPSELKIILADGSAHAGNYLVVSPNQDLALLSLYSAKAAHLEKPPTGKKLNQGDKVYAIGSPVGLRHTVTAGIFSGFRAQGQEGHVFLQTDAAINPGNSGGPIIDESGYVRGVTTMILRDTEGIGFAIPIEKVYEEFGSTLF